MAILVVLLIVLAAVLGCVYMQPMWLLRFVAAHSPEVLYYIPTTRRVVALTIDDAPHPAVTPAILDVLKENGARATFFVIGDHARGNEALLRRMVAEGHEIGNHFCHEELTVRLTAGEFERQLLEVDRLLTPGSRKWFRPGSGFFSRRMLAQASAHGYRCALGSVYPFDPAMPSAWITSKYIASQVFPGSVIILHDGKPYRIRTAKVLRRVLPQLAASGYRIVTLSELVAETQAG